MATIKVKSRPHTVIVIGSNSLNTFYFDSRTPGKKKKRKDEDGNEIEYDGQDDGMDGDGDADDGDYDDDFMPGQKKPKVKSKTPQKAKPNKYG